MNRLQKLTDYEVDDIRHRMAPLVARHEWMKHELQTLKNKHCKCILGKYGFCLTKTKKQTLLCESCSYCKIRPWTEHSIQLSIDNIWLDIHASFSNGIRRWYLNHMKKESPKSFRAYKQWKKLDKQRFSLTVDNSERIQVLEKVVRAYIEQKARQCSVQFSQLDLEILHKHNQLDEGLTYFTRCRRLEMDSIVKDYNISNQWCKNIISDPNTRKGTPYYFEWMSLLKNDFRGVVPEWPI